ncbi:aminodeoxychorismate synthase component I [Pseudonocardia aurantiaca]|uniref:Aminodeoxychorismate synthase component I n=1 Tax=Pseudonocardia aurantiaca TaxID=75290 RepID=A0ABW4FG75_9PSEU
MTPVAPWARFDDLRAGAALHFTSVSGPLVAHSAGEVTGVLREVERATAGGAWSFGFVVYEAATGFDAALPVREPIAGLPLAWFGICAPPREVPVVVPPGERRYRVGPWTCDWDANQHRRGVDAVRAHIADGDTYQANLTTRMRAAVRGDMTQLYTDLALGQRGAHNAYLDVGRFVIAGASPELFFEIRDGRLHMRPMKGTASRGRTTAEDAVLIERLRTSAKERAENVMIVDLVRNDIARVARTGSVKVTSLCRPERYETVHQLTSDVTADLRPDVGLADVFGALFPCGSVTGAPKAGTMQIIRDLEPGPRGIYCGAVGFVAPPGSPVRARFNVAIRTVLVDRQAGTATYGTGGGITWESDPAAEYAELLAKARVLATRPDDFHLIETMRHDREAGLVALGRHLARLQASAAYFGFPFDPGAARSFLAARLAGVGDARVRLLAFRDGKIAVNVDRLPPRTDRPVLLAVDDDPIDSRDCWPHHKTSRRKPYTSRRARHPDADEVVLVNERGEITETTTANLAVHLDGRWWTPPLGGGCLPGVERGRLIELGALAERVLRPDDLHRATGLAVVNALRGWRSATLAAPGRAKAAGRTTVPDLSPDPPPDFR